MVKAQIQEYREETRTQVRDAGKAGSDSHPDCQRGRGKARKLVRRFDGDCAQGQIAGRAGFGEDQDGQKKGQ